MISLVLRKPNGETAVFPFENDALQSFLSEAAAAGAVCEFVGLRGGGMTLSEAAAPRPKVDAPAPKGKGAGPGTVRSPVPQPKPEKK